MNPHTEFWTVFLITMLAFCLASVGQIELPVRAVDSQSELGKLRENAKANRIRLKTTVNDALLEKFQQGQAISVAVPPGNERSISSLLVRKPECFKSEAVVVRPRTRAEGKVVIVELSRQLFDRLDYQPIRIRIFESSVERIDLVPATRITDPEEETPSNTISPEFYIRLKPANGVSASFKNNNSFRLTNDVFDHEIPFEEIEAVFFQRRR